MALTTAQLQAIKAAINADPTLSVLPNDTDSAFAIAAALNVAASPSWTVWKSSVPITQVGDKFNGSELGGLTTANQTRLQTIALFSANGVNPSLADRRAFFDDVFSGAGGATTRANLLALWKRFATRAEKACATGTGTDVSPATLSFEGTLSYADVQAARVS